MKHVFLVLLLTAHALLAKSLGIYSDKELTPGLVAPVTQAEVLRAGDTMDARHVTDKTKWEVLALMPRRRAAKTCCRQCGRRKWAAYFVSEKATRHHGRAALMYELYAFTLEEIALVEEGR